MVNISTFAVLLFLLAGCAALEGVVPIATPKPTETEVSKGLIDSLTLGMEKASSELGQENGFFKNTLIHIPFPEDAKHVQDALQTLGADKLVEDTVLSLNRAAEDASKAAGEVLIETIVQLSIPDAMNILLGPQDAATTFLRNNATDPLMNKFIPIIENALKQTKATQYWATVASTYNQMNITQMFGGPIRTNLTDYVAIRALNGLFWRIEIEEKNIRKNPLNRPTPLLQKVFGFADTNTPKKTPHSALPDPN